MVGVADHGLLIFTLSPAISTATCTQITENRPKNTHFQTGPGEKLVDLPQNHQTSPC
jgi:hypothetical protein